jgi:hypothetical protein
LSRSAHIFVVALSLDDERPWVPSAHIFVVALSLDDERPRVPSAHILCVEFPIHRDDHC